MPKQRSLDEKSRAAILDLIDIKAENDMKEMQAQFKAMDTQFKALDKHLLSIESRFESKIGSV